jgi:hypothetical protein
VVKSRFHWREFPQTAEAGDGQVVAEMAALRFFFLRVLKRRDMTAPDLTLFLESLSSSV